MFEITKEDRAKVILLYPPVAFWKLTDEVYWNLLYRMPREHVSLSLPIFTSTKLLENPLFYALKQYPTELSDNDLNMVTQSDLEILAKEFCRTAKMLHNLFVDRSVAISGTNAKIIIKEFISNNFDRLLMVVQFINQAELNLGNYFSMKHILKVYAPRKESITLQLLGIDLDYNSLEELPF